MSTSLSLQAGLLGLVPCNLPHAAERGGELFALHGAGLRPIHVLLGSREERLPRVALTELTLQAASGIMSIHGRASGGVCPLGVDYLTVLTAAISLQAALAAAVGQLRGGAFQEVHISPMACGLFSIGQYLAGATAPEEPERLPPGEHDSQLRPPFTSADGIVFELESLDGGPWRLFWESVGVSSHLAGRAWKAFLLRYAKAVSPMPAECMLGLRKYSFAQILRLAWRTGVSVVPMRTPADRQGDADYARTAAMPWQLTAQPLSPTPPPSSSASVPLKLPLSGIRVIESCRRIQGPLAGQLLAMLGAEVIRLEPPGGDPLRAMPPCTHGCSVRFDALNRSKVIREVDIKSAAGRQTIYDLTHRADVFLHNWAPRKAEELALDASHLHAVRPDLVYAYAGGWGGAAVLAPGTDFTVQAWSGVADAVARTSGTRGGSLFTVLDVLGGVICALGVTAALLRRALRGTGSEVQSSLLGTADLLLAGTRHAPPLSLLSGVYPTADGRLAIDCSTPQHVHSLATLLDSPDRTASGCEASLVSGLPTGCASAWEAALNRAGIPACAVQEDLAQMPADPRLASCLQPSTYSRVNPPWSFL